MDEYIEREAAIAAIMSEPPDAHYPQWYADKIKAIPTANVAPVRHGRWIYEPVEFSLVKDIRCSVCRRYVKVPEDYCPGFGAKMDLEEPNEAKESGQP